MQNVTASYYEDDADKNDPYQTICLDVYGEVFDLTLEQAEQLQEQLKTAIEQCKQ